VRRNTELRTHLVGAIVGLHLLPHPVEALCIGERRAHRRQNPALLCRSRTRLTAQGDGITGEIADLDVEDLVHQVTIQSDQTGLLENQLTVDDEREQVPDDEGEVQVSLLFGIWRGSGRPDLPINPNFYFIR
jgi:hypothetical protein